MKSITSAEEVDLNKALDDITLKIISENSEKDIKEQKELFEKWSQEQEFELKQQVHNFLVDERKKRILERLEKLERQEEILKFFDDRYLIRLYGFNRGFPKENPTNIPIEPEESQYKILFEKHFKTWRHKNKPARLLTKSYSQKLMEESLSTIYLNHRNKA